MKTLSVIFCAVFLCSCSRAPRAAVKPGQSAQIARDTKVPVLVDGNTKSSITMRKGQWLVNEPVADPAPVIEECPAGEVCPAPIITPAPKRLKF